MSKKVTYKDLEEAYATMKAGVKKGQEMYIWYREGKAKLRWDGKKWTKVKSENSTSS